LSEQTGFKNPYAADNMPEGGGLTRDIIVTSAKYVTYGLVRKDGSAVIDDRTKQQSVFTGLRIEAIREGGDGKVEKYEWSAGRKARPSADGELLIDEKGELAKVYKTSNLGKAIEGLRAGGFDPQQLYPRVSILVGSRITLEGVNKVDAAGKPKTHTYEGKVYNDIEWFPAAYKGGAGAQAATPSGAASDAIEAKAEAAVVAAITEAGGSMERKDLIRALGTSLKGDPDAIKVTTLVARQDFHTGRPWTLDGTALKLGA
jgi:hypothetical protein